MEYYAAIKIVRVMVIEMGIFGKNTGKQGIYRQQFQVNVHILMWVRRDFRQVYLVYGFPFL